MKTRREDLWSKHSNAVHPASPGSPFAGQMMMSCIRCGVHHIPARLGKDSMFVGQRRCIDRELCATARGGKS